MKMSLGKELASRQLNQINPLHQFKSFIKYSMPAVLPKSLLMMRERHWKLFSPLLKTPEATSHFSLYFKHLVFLHRPWVSEGQRQHPGRFLVSRRDKKLKKSYLSWESNWLTWKRPLRMCSKNARPPPLMSLFPNSASAWPCRIAQSSAKLVFKWVTTLSVSLSTIFSKRSPGKFPIKNSISHLLRPKVSSLYSKRVLMKSRNTNSW